MSFAPALDQTKTLPTMGDAYDITPSSFEELGVHSSNQHPNDSKKGWTKDQEAELESELTLALVEQGSLSLTNAPSFPQPHFADA
jgi:hypothetical protein